MNQLVQKENNVPGQAVSLPAPQRTLSPLVEAAMNNDMDPTKLEKLLEIQMQYEAHEARKAFHAALADFKQNPPKVVKDKLNNQYGSNYASIGNMVNTVNEALGAHGLNARWQFPPTKGNNIICTCILSHRFGHEESVTLSAPIDESGKKNPIQARKSTRTYLKLETFEAVTGIASMDGNLDDDGNAAGQPAETITEDQYTILDDLLKETKADKDAFLKHFKIDDLSDLNAKQFTLAHNMLLTKKKQANENTES